MPDTSYMLGTAENYTDLVETLTDELIFFTPFPAWIFAILCVSGAFGNLVNIVLLTRPKMVSSINILLTFVEGNNFFIFLYFVPALMAPYTYNFNISFTSVVFKVIETCGESITVCISSWLSVFIALWRYIAVEWPLKTQIVCSKKNAILVIVFVVVFSIINDIPEMMVMMNYSKIIFTICESSAKSSEVHSYPRNITSYDIKFVRMPVNQIELYNNAKRNVTFEFGNRILPFALANQTKDYTLALEKEQKIWVFDLVEDDPNDKLKLVNTTLYEWTPSSFFFTNDHLVIRISVWLMHFTSTIPCACLVVVSALLVKSLWEARKRRNEMLLAASPTSEFRITCNILVIVMLFFVANLPYTIFNISVAIGGPENIISNSRICILFCNSITIFVYAGMSKLFRETLYELFTIKKTRLYVYLSAKLRSATPTT